MYEQGEGIADLGSVLIAGGGLSVKIAGIYCNDGGRVLCYHVYTGYKLK